MAIPSFVDRVKLTVQAGNGGHGCASVHREKFKPLGGPDGGNGGEGGSVVLRVDDSLSTLVDYHRQSVRKATNGQPGKGDMQHGPRGESIVLAVPTGTVASPTPPSVGSLSRSPCARSKPQRATDEAQPARIGHRRLPPATYSDMFWWDSTVFFTCTAMIATTSSGRAGRSSCSDSTDTLVTSESSSSRQKNG